MYARDCPEVRPRQQSTLPPAGCTATAQRTESTLVTGMECDNSRSNNYKASLDTEPTFDLYSKVAIINQSFSVPCLIDSGSTACLLREDAARQMEIQWDSTDAVICGFGEHASTAVSGRTKMDFQIDDAKLNNVPVYIVPNNSTTHKLIIGRPWSGSDQIAFVKYGNKLKFFNTNKFPCTEISPDALGKPPETLRVLQDTVLAPRSETVVTAMVADVVIDVPLKNALEKEVVVHTNQLLARRVTLGRQPLPDEQTTTRPLLLSDIPLPDALNENEREELMAMLNCYRCCFALN